MYTYIYMNTYCIIYTYYISILILYVCVYQLHTHTQSVWLENMRYIMYTILYIIHINKTSLFNIIRVLKLSSLSTTQLIVLIFINRYLPIVKSYNVQCS